MNPLYLDYRVKVFTKSHKEEVVKSPDGRFSVYTKMPAENGLANLDIVLQLSKALDVPQKNVMIVRGHTEPNKTVRVYTS